MFLIGCVFLPFLVHPFHFPSFTTPPRSRQLSLPQNPSAWAFKANPPGRAGMLGRGPAGIAVPEEKICLTKVKIFIPASSLQIPRTSEGFLKGL